MFLLIFYECIIINTALPVKQVGTTKDEITYISVQNLKPDALYHIKITAKNKIGSGPPYISEEPIEVGKQLSKLILNSYTLYNYKQTIKNLQVKFIS